MLQLLAPKLTTFILCELQSADGRIREVVVNCPDHFQLRSTLDAHGLNDDKVKDWRYLKGFTTGFEKIGTEGQDAVKDAITAYIDKQVQDIIDETAKYQGSTTRATCDAFNWDRQLHRMMPQIASKLRALGYSVSSQVRFGVTDWTIVMNAS